MGARRLKALRRRAPPPRTRACAHTHQRKQSSDDLVEPHNDASFSGARNAGGEAGGKAVGVGENEIKYMKLAREYATGVRRGGGRGEGGGQEDVIGVPDFARAAGTGERQDLNDVDAWGERKSAKREEWRKGGRQNACSPFGFFYCCCCVDLHNTHVRKISPSPSPPPHHPPQRHIDQQ